MEGELSASTTKRFKMRVRSSSVYVTYSTGGGGPELASVNLAGDYIDITGQLTEQEIARVRARIAAKEYACA